MADGKTTIPVSERAKPSDLDGQGYSDKSYKPGYELGESLCDTSEEDMKRGFKPGG